MAMHRNAEKFARRHLDRQAREEREEQAREQEAKSQQDRQQSLQRAIEVQRRNQERLQRIEAQRKPQALQPLSPGEVYGGQYKTQATTSPEPEEAEEPEEFPDLRTVIAERLQSEDFELSYNLLAAESGVDSGTISRFVRGERDITTATAWKLCKVLGLVLVPIERVTS